MEKIVVYYTPTFVKQFKKLPAEVKQKAYRQEKIFKDNLFNSLLKTHKLSGKLKKYWSFSIDYQYRIIFRFIAKNQILFVDVGTHSVYK